MKKAICIPDSFKGTMSSGEVCKIMSRSILAAFPDAEVVSVPVADGGEGSVDAFLAAVGGEKIKVTVKGPDFKEVPAFYGVIDGGRTAVIEMAACAGLPLAGGANDPRLTTTYGVGELMLHAIHGGCRKIILGLGGSATNDGGAGAAAALGAEFFDRRGGSFVPVGGTLKDVARIDLADLPALLNGVSVVAMCDVDNPMTGPAGAAAVFSPQKGASPETVEELDRGLRHFSDRMREDLGKDVSAIPGSGAAGGMGGGAVAIFDARLSSGIETVLEAVHFDDLLKGADIVFTGEGRIDAQSLGGKTVIGVAGHTKKAGVPLIAVVGDIGDDAQGVYEKGVNAVFSINRVAVDFPAAKVRARSDLALTMDNLMRFIQTMTKR